MGKSTAPKPTKAAAAKPSKAASAGLTKASKPKVATSKDIAKKAVAAISKKDDKKKSKKAPTPEPESDSDDSSESESEDSASDSSDSESEEEKKEAKKADKDSDEEMKDASDDSSDSDSDDSDSSDESDSEDEKKPVAKKVEVKVNGDAKKADSDSDSDSSDSDSSDSDSDSDAEEETKAEKEEEDSSDDSSDSDSSSDSSDSDSDSEKEEEKKKEETVTKKRKADVEVETPVKRAKAVAPTGEGSTILFVGSLSWNIDDEWLFREFESYGATSARVVTDREKQRSKGFGYVEFNTHEEAKKALEELNGTDLDGRNLNIDFSTPRPPKPDANERRNKFGDQRSEPSDTVFVANLAFEADENAVHAAFEKFGTIQHIRIPTDKDSGERKGFGYVQFSSIEEATAAVEAMAGVDIQGRTIRTDFSSPRPQNNGGFNDRGGRGGGRGGRGGGRGGFGGRGGRGGGRGGRGGFAPNPGRGSVTEFKGKKISFD